MSEVGVSPVSEKGQVTIPKEIRDAMGLKKGDKVVFLDKDNQIIIRKARSGRLSEILLHQKPWKVDGVVFQKKLRKEWE
jgi:AbrB family looped-hinge helix DNA binding protein